jgi:CheY-like chemotaxis protein
MNERPTILVVDDDAAMRFLVSLGLQDAGYRVVLAANGREALDRLDEQTIDLVLTDVQMPIMTGIQLLGELRAQGRPIPVFVMSAGTNDGAEAIAYGANGFFAKRQGLDKLPGLVKLWLGTDPGNPEESKPSMGEAMSRSTIVVLNSNDDLLVLLAEIGEAAGFDIVTAHTMEVGPEPEAIRAFLRRHNPKVVVYDVSPPYPENWTLYREVHEGESESGSRRQFVVTTPNKDALEQHVGPTVAIELVGDKADRAVIAEAIQRAMLV